MLCLSEGWNVLACASCIEGQILDAQGVDRVVRFLVASRVRSCSLIKRPISDLPLHIASFYHISSTQNYRYTSPAPHLIPIHNTIVRCTNYSPTRKASTALATPKSSATRPPTPKRLAELSPIPQNPNRRADSSTIDGNRDTCTCPPCPSPGP